MSAPGDGEQVRGGRRGKRCRVGEKSGSIGRVELELKSRGDLRAFSRERVVHNGGGGIFAFQGEDVNSRWTM